MIRKAKDVFGDQELAVVTFRVPRDLFAEFLCICTRRGEQHRVVIAEMLDQYVREHYDEFVQSVVSSPKAGVRVHHAAEQESGKEVES